MKLPKISRRDVLKGSAAVASPPARSLPSAKVLAQAPPAAAITPELIKAAQKEGRRRLVHLARPAGGRAGRASSSRRATRASRRASSAPAPSASSSASGRNTRSKIHAVDVVQSSDAAHFIVWKRNGILLPFVPEDVAKHWPEDHRDPDGQFATFRAWLCCLGYNTNMVKARRGAEELRRSARSEMGRQDGEGASRLQRHHHDRDVPDHPRARLGVPREARQAEDHAGAVRRPIRPRSSRSASAR